MSDFIVSACIMCGRRFRIYLSEEHVTNSYLCSARCEDDYDAMVEEKRDGLIDTIKEITLIGGMRV